MKPPLIRHILLSGLTVFIMVAIGFGCQSKLVSHEGKTASQENNIFLQDGGPQSGQWKSNDVLVNYTYSKGESNFQIEGTVELMPRLTKSFRDVGDLSVRANLLDEGRIILKSVTILIVGAAPIQTWRFTESFASPPEAKAMNFSYRGTAYQTTDGGRIDQDFWQVP